jgi:hypothetical protein
VVFAYRYSHTGTAEPQTGIPNRKPLATVAARSVQHLTIRGGTVFGAPTLVAKVNHVCVRNRDSGPFNAGNEELQDIESSASAASLRRKPLSGPASRRVLFHPCASLSLHLHLVVKGTPTPKLSNMLGTPQERPAACAAGRHCLSVDSGNYLRPPPWNPPPPWKPPPPCATSPPWNPPTDPCPT